MGAGWAMVPLGEVMRPALDPHPVDPVASYPIAGVYGFGRGMIKRAPTTGQEIAAPQLFRIRSGQFIYSRLKSFEGAFAIVSDDADGFYVSNEFPTFDAKAGLLDPAYLGWYFKQKHVWQALASDNKGIGARRERLHPDRLLVHEIPLPPLDEQRRIVARIDALAAKIAEARGLRILSIEELQAQWPATLRVAFNGGLVSHLPVKATATQLLARSAEINAGYAEMALNNAYPHKPRVLTDGRHAIPRDWCWTTLGSVLTHMVDCVNDTPNFSEADTGLLGLKTTNIRPYRLELQRRWFVTPSDFASWNRREAPKAGDIVLTREAPVGNVCMIPEGLSVCLTQRLMLLRPEARAINARYLLHFLNSPCFAEQITASGRGQTHPHIRVGDAPHFLLPLPPMEQQHHIVAELDALQAKVDAVKRLQVETATELDALLPAILDRAFKGEL